MKFKDVGKKLFPFVLLAAVGPVDAKIVNVEFTKENGSLTYSGLIKGYNYDAYKFKAKKGQKIHINISNEDVDTILFGPGINDSIDLSDDMGMNNQFALPASGEYEIRVLQPSNGARDQENKKYKIFIEIR